MTSGPALLAPSTTALTRPPESRPAALLRLVPEPRPVAPSAVDRPRLLREPSLLDALTVRRLPADVEVTAAMLGADCELVVLLSGGICRRHVAPDGRHVSSLVLPGDLIIATDEQPSAELALGRTWRDSQLGILSVEQANSLMLAQPQLGPVLLKSALEQHDRMRQNYLDLVFRDVAGRVAKLLLLLEHVTPTASQRGGRVDHGLTQSQLADLVAASRETVNKALGDFARRGWIVLEERSFLLLDRAGLERRIR